MLFIIFFPFVYITSNTLISKKLKDTNQHIQKNQENKPQKFNSEVFFNTRQSCLTTRWKWDVWMQFFFYHWCNISQVILYLSYAYFGNKSCHLHLPCFDSFSTISTYFPLYLIFFRKFPSFHFNTVWNPDQSIVMLVIFVNS